MIIALYLIFGRSLGDLLASGATWREILGAALLVPGYARLVVSPAWTLVYEIYFYLLFGLPLFLPRNMAGAALTMLFFGSVVVGEIAGITPDSPLNYVLTNPVLLEFLVGVYIALVAASPRFSLYFQKAWVVNLLLLGGLIGLAAIPFLAPYGVPKLFLLGGPSAPIVAWAVFADRMNMVPRFVSKLSFLGDSSYSLYLIHILVMAKLMPLGPYIAASPLGSPMGLVLSFSAVSLVVGLVVHRFLERPLHIAIRNQLTAAA